MAATSFWREWRNEVEDMIGRVIEAEFGLGGERKPEKMSSHDQRHEEL